MAKEMQSEKVVIENSLSTVKSTAYSKKDYEWLVENAMDMIRVARKNKWNKAVVADIHGFFYAAMAGIIRSGALCNRDTANDGFPEIHTIIQDTDYHCRENVLYAILGNDASEVIHPYEDTFSSYASDPNHQNLGQAKTLFEEKDTEKDISGNKKKYSKEEMEAARTEIESLKNQLVLAEAKSQKELVEVKTELKAVKESKTFLEEQFRSNSGDDRFTSLQNKLLEATNEVADSKILIEKIRQEKRDVEKNIVDLEEKLKEEKEKKKEEPAEYDYYYREVLPRVAATLGMHGGELAIKVMLSLISVVGIAAAIFITLI